MKADVLITCGNNRVSYAALRSLASLGLKVAVADTGKVGMCQWSRYSQRSYVYADPQKYPEAFVDDISRILKDSGAKFLLPVLHDTEVLARYRDRLPADVILPLPGYDAVRTVSDKGLVTTYAREARADVPEVIDWDGWDDLEAKLEAVHTQMVVKLRRMRHSRWVFYPGSSSGALDMCRELAARYSLAPDQMPIVQRRVNGEGWGVGCLYHEGRMLASSTYRMLREKVADGGTGTLRVSQRDRGMEACAKQLLDGLSWHGLAVVEFKYDRESDKAWFIEISPFLWGAIGLAVAAGVDFFKLLYIASTQGPDEAEKLVRPQKDGVVSRWWLGDALRAASEAKQRRPVKALKLLLPGGTDFYDDFRMDDPGASAGWICNLATGSRRKKQHNQSQV